jgi:hypothetical protein
MLPILVVLTTGCAGGQGSAAVSLAGCERMGGVAWEVDLEAERYELCPVCKKENKKYSDIRQVCPQVTLCADCMEQVGSYPDRCPDDRKKIAAISDAATWFQCCR